MGDELDQEPETPIQFPKVPWERCPNCGHPNPPEAELCEQCGNRLRGNTPRFKSRRKNLGCLMQVLFGVIGIPALLIGACFAIVGLGNAGARPGTLFYTPAIQWVPIALGGFLIFGLLPHFAFKDEK